MKVGDWAETLRTFTAADCAALVVLTGEGGDGVHVPEPLLAAMISTLLGTRLPGRGTNYLKQDLHFAAAARLGQPVTARVTVTRLRPAQGLVDLHACCADDAGRVLCEGRALVRVPPQT